TPGHVIEGMTPNPARQGVEAGIPPPGAAATEPAAGPSGSSRSRSASGRPARRPPPHPHRARARRPFESKERRGRPTSHDSKMSEPAPSSRPRVPGIGNDSIDRESTMKIRRIAAYRVDLPLHEGSYRWSGGKSVTVFDSTIVRVETDAGIVGHGEV